MIHSRPGFAPRTSDEAPAALNQDMIPAINRPKKGDETTPIKHNLDARTEAAYAKLKRAQAAIVEAEAQVAMAKVGPDLLVNPEPSAAPKILEPGK
jgi:hypothetical protein